MNDDQKLNCRFCLHALFQDYGYSNYTTEGTDFTCKLGLHPNGTFDRFYGDDKRLDYAAKCEKFERGESEYHYVDCPYDCGCKGTAFERKEKR